MGIGSNLDKMELHGNSHSIIIVVHLCVECVKIELDSTMPCCVLLISLSESASMYSNRI